MTPNELLKHQAAQDQAQIHNMQMRLADAISRAEKAESELKALHEQQPLLYIQFSDCGAHIRFWTRSKQRMQEQQAAAPESPMVTLYARPTPSALQRDATRVIVAWDGTVLPKSHDGRLQQEMEHLRESIGATTCAHEYHAGRPNGDGTYQAVCVKCGESCVPAPATSNSVEFDGIKTEHTPQHSAAVDTTYPIPAEWRAAVIGAREQFQHYASLHRAKGAPDSDEKAQVNQDYADMLTSLLNNTSAPAQTPATYPIAAEWLQKSGS